MRGKLWDDPFWSDGYFYRFVGSTTAEHVRYYVQNGRKRKHWVPQVGSKSALLEGNVNRQTMLADFS